MKRKKKYNLNVDAIITSDWHIMEHTPPCRLDEDFLKLQEGKVLEISDLQKKYECAVYHAGDVFEKPRPSLYLVKWLMDIIPDKFKTILGNHDMPKKNIQLVHKSGVGLMDYNSLNVIPGSHYGNKNEIHNLIMIGDRKILTTHEMVWEGKSPWPGCTDPEINELFDKYPEPDLIITGHNHKTITVEKDGRLIINPGSLTRHKADQTDHKPCVFLYDSIKNNAVPHYLKINEGVMSREHIEIKKSKELRLQKFNDSLNMDDVNKIDFVKNVEIILNQNKVGRKIEQIIEGWME